MIEILLLLILIVVSISTWINLQMVNRQQYFIDFQVEFFRIQITNNPDISPDDEASLLMLLEDVV